MFSALRLFFFFTFTFMPTYSVFSQEASLSRYQWQNRLLFIVHSQSDQSVNMMDSIERYQQEITERDLLLFIIHHNEVYYPNGTREQSMSGSGLKTALNIGQEDRAVLVGKDGGVKLRQAQINMDGIFSTIDQMPMRKREMNDY
jgi:hypothetical protein